MPPVVYIAGERQHAGKTVASLGLISALSSILDPKDIGYFKPVGQELVELPSGERIDKDIQILREFTGLDMPNLGILSPVRVVAGVTRAFVTSEDPRSMTTEFETQIKRAISHLSHKKLIIAEGTGHPGVGSVIGLSNARVANLLGAKILYLVGGGIGRTLDELEVDLSYFSHHHSQVAGVLFNKVNPEKVAGMAKLVNEPTLARLFPEWDPPLSVFGHMPVVEFLNNPSMHLLAQSFKDHRGIHDEQPGNAWFRACRKVKIITQDNEVFCPERRLRPRDIAVIGAGSLRRVRRIVAYNDSLPDSEKLGGLILTCANEKMPSEMTIAALDGSKLPTFAVPQDTAETDALIYECYVNTKLQPYDKMKYKQIVKLFNEHFDAERFIRVYGL